MNISSLGIIHLCSATKETRIYFFWIFKHLNSLVLLVETSSKFVSNLALQMPTVCQKDEKILSKDKVFLYEIFIILFSIFVCDFLFDNVYVLLLKSMGRQI